VSTCVIVTVGLYSGANLQSVSPDGGLRMFWAVHVMEDIPYKEKTVKLEPGDSILLFSDGVTEIQNAQNEWLGVEGFTQILKRFDYPKAPLSMNTLEEKLLMFSNDIRLQDDLTIIEARYFG